jgi:hypothetical protein
VKRWFQALDVSPLTAATAQGARVRGSPAPGGDPLEPAFFFQAQEHVANIRRGSLEVALDVRLAGRTAVEQRVVYALKPIHSGSSIGSNQGPPGCHVIGNLD